MKKFIILAAVLLTIGITNANAGLSFEISIGDRHHHGKGHGGHGGHARHAHQGRGGYSERHYAPSYTPHYAPHHAPRYVVRECSHRHGHGYYGHSHGYRHGCGDRRHHGHRH